MECRTGSDLHTLCRCPGHRYHKCFSRDFQARHKTIYWVYGTAIMDDPENYKGSGYVGASTKFWSSTKAYSYQMVIEYALSTDAGWRTQTMEVPLGAYYDLSNATYPSVVKSYIYAGGGYSKQIYMNVLQQIGQRNAGSKIVFKRIVFRFLQVDQTGTITTILSGSFRTCSQSGSTSPISRISAMGMDCSALSTVDSLEHSHPPQFPYNR